MEILFTRIYFAFLIHSTPIWFESQQILKSIQMIVPDVNYMCMNSYDFIQICIIQLLYSYHADKYDPTLYVIIADTEYSLQ